MKILTVTSGKGGVGKSTLSLNIARQLSLGGKKTLLIDFDIHNKGLTNLFLPSILESSVSVTEIIAASDHFSGTLPSELLDRIEPIPVSPDNRVLFVPASRPTEMMEWHNFVAENDAIVAFFQQLLHALAKRLALDVILIDCYGGIDSLTIAASGIADDTIIVNEPDLITFGGTLTLYAYLARQYEHSVYTPQVHFVINRISSRYSFDFLRREYQKNLAALAVDSKILAYFPYDKLLIDTFGNYPFFSELLPKGLFTRKIQLLIATMWGASGYESFSKLSPRNRKHVFESTSETGYADPEAILGAVTKLPFLMVIPVLLLLFLHSHILTSLNYWMICALLYTAGAVTLLLAFLIGVFEPFQIARWMLRQASYNRRKRNLTHHDSAVYRATTSVIQFAVASFPALVSVAIFFSIGFFLNHSRTVYWNSDGRLEEISIWRGQVSGLRPYGHYQVLQLNPEASIAPGTDLTGTDFTNARLNGVKFNGGSLVGANFKEALLEGSSFENVDMSRTKFAYARLQGAKFDQARLVDADFTDAFLQNAIFQYLDMSGSIFSTSSLQGVSFGPGLILADGSKRADFSRASFVGQISLDAFDTLRYGNAILPKPFAPEPPSLQAAVGVGNFIMEGIYGSAKLSLENWGASLPLDDVNNLLYLWMSLRYAIVADAKTSDIAARLCRAISAPGSAPPLADLRALGRPGTRLAANAAQAALLAREYQRTQMTLTGAESNALSLMDSYSDGKITAADFCSQWPAVAAKLFVASTEQTMANSL